MSFNTNFNSATLQAADRSLVVEGTSIPANGSDDIRVLLFVDGAPVGSEKVPNPEQGTWSVVFEEGATPFVVHGSVFLIGVAQRPAGDPVVWQGSFEILTRTDVPRH
jgi:hypothetical protein